MKKLLNLLLLGCIFPSAIAQITFEKVFRGFAGTDESTGLCVGQTSDGGYVILASTWTGEVRGFMMIRTTASGDTVLTRSFSDMANSFAATPDGGYMITGCRENRLMMLKTDAEFNTQWCRTTGMTLSVGGKVATTGDGGYLFTGSHSYNVNMGNRLLFVRTDSAGDTLWTRYYGAQDEDFYGASLILLPDGSFMVSGSLRELHGGPSVIFLMKADAGGDSLWMKTYRRFEYTYGLAAVTTPGDGYLIAGTTASYTEEERYWIIYTDGQGDTLRTRSFDGNQDMGFITATSLRQGGALLAATRKPDSLSAKQVWLLRLSEAGDTLWTKLAGTADHEYPYSVRQTADDGFVITGMSLMNPDRPSAIYLVKTDSSGNYYPVGIEHRGVSGPVTVTPNPAKEFVDVGCSGPVESIRVYNGMGEPVLTLIRPGKGPAGCRVPLAGLPCGLYLLEINTGQVTLCRKVIKTG